MAMAKAFIIARTAFLFGLFGLICLLGDGIFIFVCLFGLNKFKSVRTFCRFLVRISWKFYIKICALSGYLRYEFDPGGLGEGGELIVANHPSLLDVVFMLSHVKNLNCIVKGDLASNIFLAFAIRACGYISNDDNEALLARSLQALNSGESLLVFPEGTRTKEQINFHKAPFYIAIKVAKKLTPVFIDMQPRSLAKNQSWHDQPSKTIGFKFSIKPSVSIADFHADRADPVRVRLLQEEILKIYKELE